jgi:hypothetical protein
MPLDHTLINLKRELIRTFAVVDEWFDKAHSLCTYKPLSGGWSINEVLEHVMLTNHFLLVLIEKGTAKALKKSETSAVIDVPDNYVLGTPALLQIADPNAFAWQRPDHHQPTGDRPMCEVRREIRNQLERCLITLELLPNGEGILYAMTMSVNSLGKLDVYQYLYFLALHAQRHLKQMQGAEHEYEVIRV